MSPSPRNAYPVGFLGAVVCLLLAAVALSNDWWFAAALLLAGATLLLGWAMWVGGRGNGGDGS